MYVQLTIELVAKAVKLFCSKKKVEMNAKDAKKVFASLVDDNDVAKYFFCEAICKTSKRTCMKEVGDKDMQCHVHDPARKCHGTTALGKSCGSVSKAGEDYCWRHRVVAEKEGSQKRGAKKTYKKISKENIKKFPLHPTCDSEEQESSEDEPAPRRKSRKPHTPEYVVDSEDSEEEAVSEDEKPVKKPAYKDATAKGEARREVPMCSSEDDCPSDETSDDDEEEHAFALSSNVRDITSMRNLPLAKDGGWVKYPLDEDMEYATNFTIKGKYIMRLTGKNVYVELCPPASMGGKGDAPDVDIIERSILSKMELREMSTSERQKLYQEEPATEVEVVHVDGPTDKPMIKWKKFDKHLEYSKNLRINGKHILKKRKESVVVGLVTEDHIRSENVEYDMVCLKEKEKLFTMGFIVDVRYNLVDEQVEDESSDEEPQDYTPEMADAYKEHPDILWIILENFRDHTVAEVSKNHGIKRFNDNYAQSFMVLDLRPFVEEYKMSLGYETPTDSSEDSATEDEAPSVQGNVVWKKNPNKQKSAKGDDQEGNQDDDQEDEQSTQQKIKAIGKGAEDVVHDKASCSGAVVKVEK
ncbi:hypothetical protein EDD11_010194 [Mortierella claussenii]|nr:hypothetical protein EDD11_010194 [Mortierella claussenii]